MHKLGKNFNFTLSEVSFIGRLQLFPHPHDLTVI